MGRVYKHLNICARLLTIFARFIVCLIILFGRTTPVYSFFLYSGRLLSIRQGTREDQINHRTCKNELKNKLCIYIQGFTPLNSVAAESGDLGPSLVLSSDLMTVTVGVEMGGGMVVLSLCEYVSLSTYSLAFLFLHDFSLLIIKITQSRIHVLLYIGFRLYNDPFFAFLVFYIISNYNHYLPEV